MIINTDKWFIFFQTSQLRNDGKFLANWHGWHLIAECGLTWQGAISVTGWHYDKMASSVYIVHNDNVGIVNSCTMLQYTISPLIFSLSVGSSQPDSHQSALMEEVQWVSHCLLSFHLTKTRCGSFRSPFSDSNTSSCLKESKTFRRKICFIFR